MNRLRTNRNLVNRRPRCFLGAVIGAVGSIAGSIIGGNAQRRERRRQERAQDYANMLEEAKSDSAAMNSMLDYNRNYLSQFNTVARLGTSKRSKLNSNIFITDGGDAVKIDKDTYLLRGGSHEQVNETGQTGIGINVGGNEVEAEGGEVAQKKNDALRIFSAQPILTNGMSPAQAILRGYNKDKVFSQQQAFKKRNGLKDDGSKAAFGNLINIPDIANRIAEYFSGTGRYTSKPIKVTPKTVAKKPIRNGQVGNFRVVNGRRISNEKPLRRVYPEFDIISMGRGLPIGKAAKATARATKNEVSYINRISKSRLYSDNPIVNTYATYARRYNLPDKARVPYMIRRVKSDEFPSINNGRITMSGGRFNHTNFTYDRPVVSHRKGKWDTAQQTYLINGRTLVSENKGNWGSIEPSDMFTVRDPKEGLTVPTKDVILVSGHKGILSQAKASGIKTATSPQLQRMEEKITPRESFGRFNFADGECRHYNTPYWISVNDIVKDYGTPKFKDVRLLEKMTGLKSGVSKLNNNAIKIINDAKGFDKLSLNEAEQVMNQTYPNGRNVNFVNNREAYITGELPYNNLFYDPATYAEANYAFPKRLGGRCKLRNGGLTSKDRGSSKHPYPSVSSKDFAGGGRSYPIPTKADAVDALRLAGLHGRSDVRVKVYSRYPELRKKARNGGSWKAPIYNTNKYRVSNRMRRQIATWEGSDFAGQNRKFKGDAIGAKERELRQIMGRTYNYLNDNQRDSLNSIYYNSRVDTFKNAFGKWFRNLNSAVDRGDERAFNNSLAGIRQSMTVGANRKGMSGLAKRRAWEQDWFGNPIPMDSNETKAILKQQAETRTVQPTDNTRVVIQPEYIEVPAPVGHGIIPIDNSNPNLLQGDIKDNLINMGNRFRLSQRYGGITRMCKALGGESRPVKGMRRKLAWGDVTYPYRRNNNFDYWDVIDQEQKAKDKGGITPWTTSNKYDVKIPLAITKSTPTIPYQNVVTPVTTKDKDNNSGNNNNNNKSTNKLGATFKNVDWASLGADLIGTIGAGIIGANAAGNTYIPEAPVRYQASKLDTNYNITPQLETIRRSRNRLANEVAGNTSSSVAAINRLNLLENNANEQLNRLYDTKENRESELLNQDALNQQSVSAQNVQAMNDYNYRVAELKNARTQAMGNVLSGTLQGIGNSFQNFFSQGRQNYDDTQAMLMGVAASDYATPSRLLELGVDVGDDAALAGIYRSAMNVPNPGARPKREDYSDNTEYSYALTRWENQNKAYQRRNSYADLIKGRMNKKNLIKYGII